MASNTTIMQKLILLLLIAFTGFVQGQTLDSIQRAYKVTAPSLNSDRPGSTYSPLTVGNNALMTQFGLDIGGHSAARWGITSSSVKAALDLRYGIGNKFEIGSFISGSSNQIELDNIEDQVRNSSSYSLNARYNAMAGNGGNLGFLADAAFGHDREENYMTYVLKSMYSISITPVVGVSTNLGYNYSEGSSWGNYTLNLGFSVFSDFGFYVEGFGNFGNTTNEFWLDGGLWYLIGPNVQLDMLFIRGFNNDVQDNTLSVGVTWRLLEPKYK